MDVNKSLDRIAGLVFKDGKKTVFTAPPKLIDNLDKLPFPARRLTPWVKYNSILARKSIVTTMITSRGCPYQCIFCHKPYLGKKYRYHSARYVVEEIEACLNMGIEEIFIHDDIFTLDKKRVIEICRGILRRKLKFGWDVRSRVNNIDMEMLKMMKKAGCERIQYGVESGNQEVLNALRKGITIQQVRNAFKMTKSIGIKTLADFIIGSPKETEKEINDSLSLVADLDPDYVPFNEYAPV